MKSIMEMSGELNRVVAYYNQDENSIDGSYYHANRLGVCQKHLLETRCSLTRDTLEILFAIKRGKAITDVSDCCIVDLHSSDDSSPSHTFIYLNGHMYHSYALKYTLRCSKMDKAILGERLDNFRSHQNEENWKAITDVCELGFTGEYIICITNIIESNVSQAGYRTKKLLNDSLEALRSGENCYDYDDYLYVLSLGKLDTDKKTLLEVGDAFLCELIERLKD